MKHLMLLVATVGILTGCTSAQYTVRAYKIAEEPSMSEEQAWAVCRGRAELSGIQARNGVQQPSYTPSTPSTYNCSTTPSGRGTNTTYNSTCTSQSTALGDSVAQAGQTLAAGVSRQAAYEDAYVASLTACMAEAGWGLREVCIADCQ